jgi:hypothetical protein
MMKMSDFMNVARDTMRFLSVIMGVAMGIVYWEVIY